MKTREEIIEELKQIKYYYSRKTEFESSAKRIVGNSIIELAEEYRALIKNAPAILYDIYICIYTQNCSQVCVAFDLDFSSEHVSRLNGKLIEYFQANLKQA